MQVAAPEHVTAVMKLIESGDVSWDDPDVTKTLREAIRGQSSKGINRSDSKLQ
jgi:CubicO group peptidase (beta-lactamase class C family)